MNESPDPIKPGACPVCGTELSGGVCPRCLMADAAKPTNVPGTTPGGETPSQAEVTAAFPQFEIIELIGAGGMGTVWRARQPKLNRHVALKLLPASLAERDPAFAERFEREGQLLARLHHPNIVTVHDSGRAGDFFYLLMEFVDGVNLRQAMRACRFTPQQALAIVPKICDALQYAHEEGVLHRDIKPENILLDAKGRVKLADFGIAKLMTQPEVMPDGASLPQAPSHGADSLTLGDTTLGTPHYMAPEQVEKPADVDHRADIYSLGVVFYELLTGELPLGKFAPPSEKSAADPRVDSIVQQALEKERDRRQQSVGEMRTQVETIAKTPRGIVSAKPVASGQWQPPDSGWGWLIGKMFGLTFTSRLAFQLANLSALGFLAFLGFVPLPGSHRCFGFSGFFGLIGVAHIVELIARKSPRPSARQMAFRLAMVFGLLVAVTTGAFVIAGHLERRQATSQAAEASAQAHAATQTGSLTLTPGVKPDLQRIFAEAQELRTSGRYEEALQRHLWLHHHGLETDPGYSAVRLSFWLSDWLELARRYPKAKQALLEIRDHDTQELAAGRGHVDLFMDVDSINAYLQDEAATLALFKQLEQSDPQLAKQCATVMESRAKGREENTPPPRVLPATLPAPKPDPDDSISLAQAVNDFNKRYHAAAAAANQPDLTVEAVLAAIRSAMLDRPMLSVTNETFAALGRMTATQMLPKSFELELLTSYEDDKTTQNVWSVRLRIPGTVIPGGTTCIMIHEQLLSTHIIGEEERKVIHAWQEKERKQGGIGSFQRAEWGRKYREEREAAAAIDAMKQPPAK